ncbi:TetR/AcrR family transcriptional regulator [Humibacter sp. BT305]|nr:TetR/AcrR family transcriptional regulator [Humibacter sp. BT305]
MAQRDVGATRARILSAAVTEFAAHGYAGGRIDRIANDAESNVRMIYAYFGNKSSLFDAALTEAIVRMATEVPPTPDDLPGWVGELYDFHRRRPETLRLCLWAQLERPEAASEPLETYLAKVESVRPQASPSLGAVDLLVIVYAIAQAWQLAPAGLLAADGGPDEDRMRAAAIESVTRILG